MTRDQITQCYQSTNESSHASHNKIVVTTIVGRIIYTKCTVNTADLTSCEYKQLNQRLKEFMFLVWCQSQHSVPIVVASIFR